VKAWQREIRDREEREDPRPIIGLDQAIVEEITFGQAKSIILKYEWLGNMGTTEKAYGLFLKGELAGVCCFGKTAGSNTGKSVCGAEWAKHVVTLCRGACAHWAHPHAASFLINAACKMMSRNYRKVDGRDTPLAHIFIAYSDIDAGEIGTVYQASNWFYCGKGSMVQQYFNGHKWMDTKGIHGATRSRKGRSNRPDETGRRYFEIDKKKYYSGDILPDGRKIGGGDLYPYIPKMSRADKKKELDKIGTLYRNGTPKHRYVGVYADRRTRRSILKALKWPILPYPKRDAGQLQEAPVAPPSER